MTRAYKTVTYIIIEPKINEGNKFETYQKGCCNIFKYLSKIKIICRKLQS